MKIFSEKTRKFYPDVKACEEAEAKYDAHMAKLEAERAAKAQERKARATEVEEAYKAAKEAYKAANELERNYIELRNKFVNDFGSFHMTYSTKEKPMTIEEFFNSFFMF